MATMRSARRTKLTPRRRRRSVRRSHSEKLRDLVKQARGGEEGADLVAQDAILAAGYSPERATKVLQHRPIPDSVRENVRRVQDKQAAKKAKAAARRAVQLPANAHRKANDQLHDLITNRYFREIPLDKIFEIVEKAGFALDPEEKACILTGRTGRSTWELFNPLTPGGKAVDHLLVVQWHKMETTGRYEIVAYVS